jgi:plasmid stabilization system protein ParE
VIIVWSPRAIEHLAHLRSYIARDNPNAAGRIAGALLDEVIAVFHARQKCHSVCERDGGRH